MATPKKTNVHQKNRNPITEDQGSFSKFWLELKRRKTIRVITVYSATSFIILQVADLIVQPLNLPSWTLTFLIILMLIGFVFAAALSWIYDITPEGIRKTTSQKPVINTNIHKRSEKSYSWKVTSLVSIIIIIILLAFNIHSRSKGRESKDFSKLEKSVAVLPFRNDSPNDTNAYFINGIMEEVLNHLQMVKDLRVISRTSVEQYRNTTKSIPEIAKEQGVNFIVEGSGQKYGNSFTVKVQLIRAVKESHLWGKSYEKEIKVPADIINVQSQIAKSIVTELKASMTPQEQQRIEKVPTSNLTAYDFYQRGREELTKYVINSDNRKALEKAEKLFRKSLEFDPVFADAIAGQALVYWQKNYWDEYLSENFMDSVLILSNIALSHDNKLSEAYFAKGEYFDAKGLKEKALAEFDKALEFNPNYWRAYIGKAFLFENDDHLKCIQNLQKAVSINHDIFSATINRMIGGKFLVTGHIDKAKEYFAKAYEIDRDSAFLLSCMGGTESDLGNYHKSVEYFKRAYLHRENYSEVIKRLGESLLFSGQPEEALEYFKEYIKLVPQDINPNVALTFWMNGLRKEADQYFNARLTFCSRALENDMPLQDIGWVYYDLASIYAFKGDREKALKNLTIYSKSTKCELWMLTHVKNDPFFETIRNEPGFRQIVSDMENNYRFLHEQVGEWLKDQGKLDIL